MTFLVRNEEDILEENIRFHKEMGVDNFLVMNNLSTDRTKEIIEELSREIDIEYFDQAEDDYNQGEWVSGMARKAATDHGADWVINNDADEFWIPECGNLKTLLSSLPPETAVLNVHRHDAVLQCKAESKLSGVSHPVFSEVFEKGSLDSMGRPLEHKVLHRASSTATVAQGNHSVDGVPGAIVDAGDRLMILHYPYRALDQYKRKIALGGAAYARNDTLHEEVGRTWRTHFDGLEDGTIEGFWSDRAQFEQEVTIGLMSGRYFRDDTVVRYLAARKKAEGQTKLRNSAEKLVAKTNTALEALRKGALSGRFFRKNMIVNPIAARRREQDQIKLRNSAERLVANTGPLVEAFLKASVENIEKVPRERRLNRPIFYHLQFAVNGAQAHLDWVKTLPSRAVPEEICADFAGLRDAFSLFPRNEHFKDFLRDLLHISFEAEVARLGYDCRNKKVVLHTSCQPRLAATEDSVATFAALNDDYHHIILLGDDTSRSENDTDLSFSYDGRFLKVPTPDTYENLHRKLFFAYMLFDLVTKPRLLVKLDDDTILGDPEKFDGCINSLLDQDAAYAGRKVGTDLHENQPHGWHLSKCADPVIEARGYQYPLPRHYAEGGFGYVLGREGLAASSYMYLAMKEFFALRAVGLEDAYVGHAMYAKGLELTDVSINQGKLALPGLTTKERQRLGKSSSFS